MAERFIIYRTPSAAPPWRCGFTLLELIAASAMMAVLLTTSLQMLRVISNHQRATDQRALAMQAIQAVAERVDNTPWDRLTSDLNNQLKIPTQLMPYLPQAKLAFVVTDEPAPAAGKRIQIELTWDTSKDRPATPIRLTTWAFPDRSTAP